TGTLRGNTTSLQGPLTVEGSLVFDQATNGTFASSIGNLGQVTKTGAGLLTLTGDYAAAGGSLAINGGILQFGNGGTTGTFGSSMTGSVSSGAALAINRSDDLSLDLALSGAGGLIKRGAGTLTLGTDSTYSGTTTLEGGKLVVASDARLGTGGGLLFDGGTLRTDASFATSRATTLNAGGGTLETVSGTTLTHDGVFGGSGTLTKTGSGTLILTNAANNISNTVVSGGTLQGNAGSLKGNIANNANVTFLEALSGTYAGNMTGSGTLTKTGGGLLTLTGINDLGGGTAIEGGTLAIGVNGGQAGTLGGAIAVNGTSGLQINNSVLAGNAITNNSVTTFAGSSSAGTSTIANNGTLNFRDTTSAGSSTITTASGSNTRFFDTASGGTARFVVNGGGQLDFSALTAGTTAGSLEGAGTVKLGANALTVGGNNLSTTLSGAIEGTGSLIKNGSGTLQLTGVNTYTGGTILNSGGLKVNGSLASGVTVNGGVLDGTGTINGLSVMGGTVAPGNSIGTMNVTGTYVQAAGTTYQVEVNGTGQSDRINVTGAPGTATLNGGTVQVLAEPGSYDRTMTYTILNATGGVSGSFTNVTSNFAFLTPTLTYDANNVYLNLLRQFAIGAQTPNQLAVATVLDLATPTATGDFANVLAALGGLNTVQGPAALNAISGQNYSAVSSAIVQGSQAFMSNFSVQAGGATRQGDIARRKAAEKREVARELSEACDAACEAATTGNLGVWGAAIGGTGSIGGNSNSGSVTYNVGGFSGGADVQLTPEFRLGMTIGYTTGSQWTAGFNGRSTTDTMQWGLYGSYVRGGLYLDGLLGYAYTDAQMQRQIVIPGLQPRTATGSTAVHQLYGQAEIGYRFDLGGRMEAYVTPYARVQAITAMQAPFTESGANSLNLMVAGQTTNSLRTVLGAQFGTSMDLGWKEKLVAQFKLGWSHEFASTDRPVTASFVGAPALPFTVYGATPQRDGVVLGLSATTLLSNGWSAYFRYEGEIQGIDNAHAGSVGIRRTW
ncbi:MAG: autotransporter domain-containing protein, partial [Reyranella sp.]